MGSMKTNEMLKVLAKFGFNVIRQNGSHMVLKNHQTNHSFVISCRINESLGRPMISKILRWANIDKETFMVNV